MWRKLLQAYVLLVWICDSSLARALRDLGEEKSDVDIWKLPVNQLSVKMTSFEEDNNSNARDTERRPKGKFFRGNQYRQYSRTNSEGLPTTTERPFIRYWNSLVRNVRLPLSALSWNITNPLVNLFNEGTPNIIETPPVAHYSENSDDAKRSRAKKSKQRKAIKRLQESHYSTEYDDVQTPVTYYNLQSADHPMYFFDPHTGNYYGVQRVRPHNKLIQAQNTYKRKAAFKNSRPTHASDDQHGYGFEEIEYLDNDDNMNNVFGLTVEGSTGNSAENYRSDINDGDEIYEDYDDPPKAGKKQKVEQLNSHQVIFQTVANNLNSFMRDDRLNRQRQRSKSQLPTPQNLIQLPRYVLFNI